MGFKADLNRSKDQETFFMEIHCLRFCFYLSYTTRALNQYYYEYNLTQGEI